MTFAEFQLMDEICNAVANWGDCVHIKLHLEFGVIIELTIAHLRFCSIMEMLLQPKRKPEL